MRILVLIGIGNLLSLYKPCNTNKSIELGLLKKIVALMLLCELCDAIQTLGVMPWDSRSDS